MKNHIFLDKISESFRSFISIGTSRSTAKLKPLHGAIAQDIADKLGKDFLVKSQGYGNDREAQIEGRYIDKMVDIAIFEKGA